MTPDRLQLAARLAAEAMLREAGDRSAFLAAACGGDTELLGEIESQLGGPEMTRTVADPLSSSGGPLVAHELQPGQEFGHYRIVSRLGEGGMGAVWLAHDTMLHRKVALKLLQPRTTSGPDRVLRFVREAKAASALNHPNIITIYEIGQSGGGHFMATEYIEGLTLRDVLKQGRPELSEVVSIVRQAAAALDTAHRADIVHRDIKPENIMIRPDGLVKVLDFGLARFTERVVEECGFAEEAITNPGTLLGTVKYMSPEQSRGLEVDHRSDIFSLGIVLYEMLSGKLPFEGRSAMDTLVSIASKPHKPLEEVAPGVPPALVRVTAKALEKDPEQRYKSARELAADLAQWDSSPPSGISSPAIPLPPPRRRDWIPWAAAALATVSGAVALYWPRDTTPVRLDEPKIVPMIGLSGTKDYAAFSPDESRIAFAWDGGRNGQVSPRNIYVKVIGAGDPVRITNSPENEQYPAWTGGGRFLSFERGSGTSWPIYRVPATGGVEEKIAETSLGHSWSPGDRLLAISRVATAAEPSGIFVRNMETGQTRRLTTAPRGDQDQFPRFSPDGKMVCFLRVLPGITESDLWLVSASGESERQITFDKNRFYGHSWSANSREIVFAATRAGFRGVWRVPARGGGIVRVPVTGQGPGNPAVSPRGDRLAWSESFTDSNIWRADGPGFNGHPYPGQFGPFQIMIQFPSEDHSPEFSPDGQRVVFASGRSGGEDLWLSDRDGGHIKQLTNTEGPTGSPHWSPDGKWIAFDSHTQGNAEIYVMAAAGGAWRRLTVNPASDTQPSWSRDGQWIYFKSNRSGKAEYYKIPWTGGDPKQITHHGAFEGFESPDGKLFYFTKGRGVFGIWTVPSDGGDDAPVPELKQAGYWRSWGVLNEGIYFVTKEPGAKRAVRFFSFSTRRIVPIAAVDKDALWWQAGLALSPDGRRLLFSQLDHAVDELMLMENFR